MAKLFIINDETPNDLLYPADKNRGYEFENRPYGYAYGGVAEPFPRELLIPRNEWQARIVERKERRARYRDLADTRGIKRKNQQRTNYCWANSPTFCVQLLRAAQNQADVSLSPASVAGPVTGYRNVGGWGKSALEYIIENGIVPSDLWPDNAIDRRYNTTDNRGVATKYRADEWWELEPRNLDQVVSCLLRNIPVSGGFNWWGHQITLSDPNWVDGDIAIDFFNSWGDDWQDHGCGTLQGNRMLPDDAVAPRTAVAA